jgi:hypothetical protein
VKVSDFQTCLRAIAGVVGTAKGENKALAEAAEALKPFANYTMADFAKFLRTVEETYRTTGKLPLVPPKPTSEALNEAIQGIRVRLANSEPLTTDAVKKELARFEALAKPQLQEVVEGLGYKSKVKTKKDAINQITERLMAGTIADARSQA